MRIRCLCLSFGFILFSINSYAIEHNVYIWQKSWKPPIKEAIDQVSPLIKGFTVLSGNLNYQNGKFSLNPVDINWSYFSSKNKEIILALRINTAASKLFKSDSITEAVNQMGDLLTQIKLKVEKIGCQVTGVQFDYDCPTSKLGDYERFLSIFRKSFPQLAVSITALPTWLSSKDFEGLIEQTSFYVLQLHVFERPKDIKAARQIFLVGEANEDVNLAASFNHPYFVSLPTYGYEVAFDKKGDFVGLKAENTPILWGKGIEVQAVMTDPKQILSFIESLKTMSSSNLKGIYWFRLPLETDEYNWSLKTMLSVLENRMPLIKIEVEFNKVNEDLIEVYLVNRGELNINSDVDLKIYWPEKQDLIYDIVGSYNKKVIDNHTLFVSGSAPRVARKMFIGWFRNMKTNEKIVLQNSGVNIYETK